MREYKYINPDYEKLDELSAVYKHRDNIYICIGLMVFTLSFAATGFAISYIGIIKFILLLTFVTYDIAQFIAYLRLRYRIKTFYKFVAIMEPELMRIKTELNSEDYSMALKEVDYLCANKLGFASDDLSFNYDNYLKGTQPEIIARFNPIKVFINGLISIVIMLISAIITGTAVGNAPNANNNPNLTGNDIQRMNNTIRNYDNYRKFNKK